MADEDAQRELLQLRKKIEELEAELAAAQANAPEGNEDLAQGSDTHTINFRYRVRNEQTRQTDYLREANDLRIRDTPPKVESRSALSNA